MIAILTDIHGNLPALEAVLSDMPAVSAVWVLGDLLGELPFPCEVLDRLAQEGRRVPVTAVAGNREVSLLEAMDGMHPDWWQGTQMRLLAWTADRLKPRHWAYLASLPLVETLQAVDGGAMLFHGSPAHVRGLIRSMQEAAEAAKDVTQRWLIGGHTHQARCYRLQERIYLNAGSVGISLDGIGGVACYALLDETKGPGETGCFSFRYVAYDVGRVLAALNNAGLEALAPGITHADVLELKTGTHHVYRLLQFAADHAAKQLGCPAKEIPPALWAEAEQLWIAGNDLADS